MEKLGKAKAKAAREEKQKEQKLEELVCFISRILKSALTAPGTRCNGNGYK